LAGFLSPILAALSPAVACKEIEEAGLICRLPDHIEIADPFWEMHAVGIAQMRVKHHHVLNGGFGINHTGA
jgi:hypothetical protein